MLAFNDFAYTDFTEVARTEFTIFQPFTPRSDESPTLYLGFNKPLTNEPYNVYFQMEEELGLTAGSDGDSDVLTTELAGYNAERASSWAAEQRVVWEYWDGDSWEPLAVDGRDRGVHPLRASWSFSPPRTGSTR